MRMQYRVFRYAVLTPATSTYFCRIYSVCGALAGTPLGPLYNPQGHGSRQLYQTMKYRSGSRRTESLNRNLQREEKSMSSCLLAAKYSSRYRMLMALYNIVPTDAHTNKPMPASLLVLIDLFDLLAEL
jgi:hypothetical protein